MSEKIHKSSIIIAFMIILWMAALLGGYYLFHKPLDGGMAAAFIRLVWTLVPALWIVSLAGGLGRRLLPLADSPSVERVFLQAMLGLGCYSLVILILGGLLGHLRWILWLLAALPLFLIFRSIRSWWQDLKSITGLWQSGTTFSHAIMILVGILCLQSLVVVIAPPIHYDALTYHLGLPAAYLQHDSIRVGADWIRGGMPQTGEMLFLWAMSFGQTGSAVVLGWAAGVMALLALASFIQRHLNPQAAWVGVAAVVSGSGVAAALGWGYIDWFCLCFGLAALICLQDWLVSRDQTILCLTGIFCGLAFTSKYTAGVILAGCLVVLIHSMVKAKRLSLAVFLVLSVGFMIPVLPWLVKNLLLTGNPLSPYLMASTTIPAERQLVIQGSAPFGNWMDIFLLPFRATIIGADGAEGYSHTIGVLFLLLGGLCWIRRVEDNPSRTWFHTCALISATTILVWIIANQFSGLLVQNRMYYAAFPAFACLAALGYYQVIRFQIPGVRMGRIAAAVVILVMGLNIIELGRELVRSQAVDYLAGVMDAREYREKNQGWYARAVQAVADSGESTILIYEPRGLDCLSNCQPDEILDRWKYDYHRLGNCEAVLQDWRSQGFTRVLVNQAGIDFFLTIDDPNHQEPDLRALNACLNNLRVSQDFGGMYQFLELK